MPKIPASNDEELVEFYATIGRAITEFAYLEEALLRVFTAALAGAPLGNASSVFYTATAFNMKLELTDSVVRFRLSGNPLYEEWAPEKGTGLKAQIGNKATQRNKVAHYHMTNFVQSKPGRRCRLEPSMYNARTWPAVTEDVVTLYKHDIEGFRRGFADTRKAVNAFAKKINALPAPSGESQPLRSGRYVAQTLRDLPPKIRARLPKPFQK